MSLQILFVVRVVDQLGGWYSPNFLRKAYGQIRYWNFIFKNYFKVYSYNKVPIVRSLANVLTRLGLIKIGISLLMLCVRWTVLGCW